MRVVTNQRYVVNKRNRWKISENIVIVFNLYVILFRIHERDTAAEINFGFATDMTLDKVLAQRFEQGTESIAELFAINKCVCVILQNQEIPLEECFS